MWDIKFTEKMSGTLISQKDEQDDNFPDSFLNYISQRTSFLGGPKAGFNYPIPALSPPLKEERLYQPFYLLSIEIILKDETKHFLTMSEAASCTSRSMM